MNRLRISFDDGWDGYAKKVTFWDARGKNPVERTLTVDLLENAAITHIFRDYTSPNNPSVTATPCHLPYMGGL